MNTYKWFNVYNKDTFEAEGLVSKELEYEFADYGLKEIRLTHGNTFGVVIDDIFLSLGLNDNNPFEFEDYACYLDPDNNDIYIGILVPDEN